MEWKTIKDLGIIRTYYYLRQTEGKRCWWYDHSGSVCVIGDIGQVVKYEQDIALFGTKVRWRLAGKIYEYTNIPRYERPMMEIRVSKLFFQDAILISGNNVLAIRLDCESGYEYIMMLEIDSLSIPAVATLAGIDNAIFLLVKRALTCNG